MESSRRISFVAFFLIWADVQGWTVPAIHLRICHWLQRRGRNAVLEVFRGAAKSTIVAVYQAWCLYCDNTYRFLDQGADDPVAYKLSKDTRAVLRRHPLCVGMMSTRQVAAGKFDVAGNPDARNSSVTAHGIMSNVTSARSDEVIFDDIEVPKNIKSSDSRQTLRARIGEATHILVPGGKKLYIGTPHTWDSIYEEQIAAGADLLKIPLFEHHARFEDSRQRVFPINFDLADAYVFLGLKLLDRDADYQIKGQSVVFERTPQGLVDVYAGNAWPEYFTREEIRFRRVESTLSAWDSQYMLVARPSNLTRLNPDRLIAYDVEPEIQHANGGVRLMLGKTQLITAATWWDCALGKINGDASALCVLFSNERGYLFWHVAQALTGDIYAQCNTILETAIRLQLPSVTVETNGPGGFVPPILRKTLAGTSIGVVEHHSVGNKDERILDGLEPPISGRFLWAHTSVLDTVEQQMRDWTPGRSNQADDYLDAAAGAIRATPVRIGRVVGDIKTRARDDWRPSTGSYDITVER